MEEEGWGCPGRDGKSILDCSELVEPFEARGGRVFLLGDGSLGSDESSR